MTNTIQTYRQITRNLTQTLNVTASRAEVKRESKYYLDNIGKIKTAEEFVGNQRLFSFAMKAFGLSDMTYAKALVRKAINEGVDNERSYANRLADPRLREFITAFNFPRRGEHTTTFAETKQGTVDRYVRQVLEETAGQSNEGVRLALYFERKAPTLTDAFSILGDKALISIVQTALDIPVGTSAMDIDKQAALIEKKLPIASLKDPEKLKRFLEKFAIKYEAANGTASSPALALFGTSATGVNSSVLASLQNLKLGGR
ncbi:MAG: DUF1217 domain-containing protein [Hyphomicrobium sp.]